MNPVKYIIDNGWDKAVSVMHTYDKTYPNYTHLQEVLKPYTDAYTYMDKTFGGVAFAKLFVNGWIHCKDWEHIDRDGVQNMLDLIKEIPSEDDI